MPYFSYSLPTHPDKERCLQTAEKGVQKEWEEAVQDNFSLSLISYTSVKFLCYFFTSGNDSIDINIFKVTKSSNQMNSLLWKPIPNNLCIFFIRPIIYNI